MYSLVGFTGFVGSNLASAYKFDGLYNTKNIAAAFETNPDLLVYAGLRAEKFLANKFPERDKAIVEEAIGNIEKINPHKIALISTIDVYKNPIQATEDSIMDKKDLLPYGLHRLELEEYIEKNFKEYFIVRLPGLFGKNIKKNFIYDFVNYIPNLLNENKFDELARQSDLIQQAYVQQESGFYKCICDENNRENLKREFFKLGFSALNFTDSRGVFQFYNLANLWRDIDKAIKLGIKKLNMATEPISISELYSYLTDSHFENNLSGAIPHYDFKSNYAKLFGGQNGYLYDKENVLRDIKRFADEYNE